VLTCPKKPQRTFDRLTKPNVAGLVAGAIKTFVADRPVTQRAIVGSEEVLN